MIDNCIFSLLLSDQQQNRHRDPALGRRQHAGGGDREVGGGGRHLPLPPQLQRHAGDHVFSQPQLHLPPQEDLAQSLQAGIGLFGDVDRRFSGFISRNP